MKAILRFNLPEENNEFMLAKRGSEWANILYTVDKQLRDWLKYGYQDSAGQPFKSADGALQAIRDFLYSEMEYSNLTFDDLN